MSAPRAGAAGAALQGGRRESALGYQILGRQATGLHKHLVLALRRGRRRWKRRRRRRSVVQLLVAAGVPRSAAAAAERRRRRQAAAVVVLHHKGHAFLRGIHEKFARNSEAKTKKKRCYDF